MASFHLNPGRGKFGAIVLCAGLGDLGLEHRLSRQRFWIYRTCKWSRDSNIVLLKVTLFCILVNWTAFGKLALWELNIDKYRLRLNAISMRDSAFEVLIHVWILSYMCYMKNAWWFSIRPAYGLWSMAGLMNTNKDSCQWLGYWMQINIPETKAYLTRS